MSRIKLLQIFAKIFKGTHIHEPEIQHFTAERIKIESDELKIISPDGELLPGTALEIECIKGVLPVFGG